MKSKIMKPTRAPVDERGQGLTEYLILLILIAVVAITATRELGQTVSSKIESAKTQISSRVVHRGKGSRSRGKSKSGIGSLLGF